MKMLPQCGVLTCTNEADPRWYAYNLSGRLVMICDGHDPRPTPSEVDAGASHHDPGDEDRRADLYCANCGDPFDVDAGNAACRLPSGAWRQCPNPSPGEPLKDCGVGGHMYVAREPRHS